MHAQIFQRAENLAIALATTRLSSIENELVRLARGLSSSERLRLVILIMNRNVRAAAAVAARIRLDALELEELLNYLIKLGKSNALRVMIERVLRQQMKTSSFCRTLTQKRSEYSSSVYFAAYYYLAGAKHHTSRQDEQLRVLMEETRPMVNA